MLVLIRVLTFAPRISVLVGQRPVDYCSKPGFLPNRTDFFPLVYLNLGSFPNQFVIPGELVLNTANLEKHDGFCSGRGQSQARTSLAQER